MAAGATATPSPRGIPKLHHDDDRPDEIGIGSIVDAIDPLIGGSISPAGIANYTVGVVTEPNATVVATAAALVLATAQLVEVILFASCLLPAATFRMGLNIWGAKDGGAAADLGRIYESGTEAPGPVGAILSLAAGSWVLSVRGWGGAVNGTVRGGAGGAGVATPIRVRARIT